MHEIMRFQSLKALTNIFPSLFISVFDQLDLVTYEEVVKLPAFKRKTLVLLGMEVQYVSSRGCVIPKDTDAMQVLTDFLFALHHV